MKKRPLNSWTLFLIIIGIYYPLRLITYYTPIITSEMQRKNKTIIRNLSLPDDQQFKLPLHNRLMDIGTPPTISNVSYIISNEDFCNKSPEVKYLIYVHTSPGHTFRRTLLRATWANKDLFEDHRTKVLFVMGRVDNSTIMQQVQKEYKQYGDIIQGDFLDTYRNLSLKGLLALKWISNNCQNIDYVIKSDDDAFINIFKLMPILNENKEHSKVMICPAWKKNQMHVMKDPKVCGKWCIKESELPGRIYYPPYCSGITFTMSHDLILDMYKAAFTTPFFWVDDVFISGLLVENIPGVKFVNLMTKFRSDHIAAWKIIYDISVPLKYYIIHVGEAAKFLNFWNNALQRLNQTERDELNPDAIHQIYL